MNELDLFTAAVAATDPARRAALLDRECEGRPELRHRLEQLLEVHAQSHQLLDRPTGRQPTPTAAYGPTVPDVGSVIAGRYKLLEPIGEGGMGTVWMAEQREPVKRLVAVKLIKAGMDSKVVLARFEAERQALALMDHPNIAKVLDGGTTPEGRPYFVMELVKGLPLTEYCDARRLTVRDRLELFGHVCSAVQHAHQKGIIHRDLKPTNVLVTEHDGKPVPKVIDFGLAKALAAAGALTDKTLHTAFGSVVGTPLYMAPEQVGINALDVDTRTDVYALGVILYELLTGTTPLEKRRLREAAWDEMRRLIREEDPPRPSVRLSSSDALPSLAAGRRIEPARLTKLVRGELDWIVMKALEKDRNRRYETASALAQDVERYLNDERVEACPPTIGYRVRKAYRRNRAPVLTVAAFAGALLVGAAAAAWQAVLATRAEADARAAAREAKADRDRAQTAEARAVREKANTQAALDFLGHEILTRASPWQVTDRDREVRTLLDRAAGRLESTSGQSPLVRASIGQMMGELYTDLGELQKARRHLEQAVDIQRNELGEEDPQTLAAMNSLARCLFWVNRYDEAAAVFDRTLEQRRRVLGEENPDTLTTMFFAGGCLSALGRHQEGEQLLRRALDAFSRPPADRDREINGAMLFLGLSLAARGQLDEAEAQLTACLARARKQLGDDPRTASVARALAWVYVVRGEPARAVPLAETAARRYRALMGDQHPFTLTAIRVLAGAYQAQGRYAEAAPLLAEARAGYRRIGEDDGPRVATTLGMLGANLVARKKYAEAEPPLRECLATWERWQPRVGEFHLAMSPRGAAREYAFTQCLLGACLLGRGQYAEAEQSLVRGYEGLTRRSAVEDPGPSPLELRRRLEALGWLEQLYTARGKPDEAAKWQAERAKYPREPAPPPRAVAR